MPVIHTHTSASLTAEQRDTLKSAFGQAISTLPGKSERWLMCLFEDNIPMYYAGDDSAPVAYVEVNILGSQVPRAQWEALGQKIMSALSNEANIPADRTYIRFTATGDWGWNNGNF